MRYSLLAILFIALFSCQPAVPIEKDGFVVIEAESFRKQQKAEVRSWVRITQKSTADAAVVDPDESHAASASGRAYLEALPDTRTTHDDKLIKGTNFSNEPGVMAVLEYPIKFTNPGRYYVWVSAYSTGSEDNGIHVGLNGTWPESGQRMQWCDGKNAWTWGSKQRTKEVHCGVEKLIYLDIPTAGVHTIFFSLREDGFEFDRFALSKEYVSPGERP